MAMITKVYKYSTCYILGRYIHLSLYVYLRCETVNKQLEHGKSNNTVLSLYFEVM